jgi:hypothetical protein
MLLLRVAFEALHSFVALEARIGCEEALPGGIHQLYSNIFSNM